MHSNRIFQYTLLVSLVLHGLILTQAPNFFLPDWRKDEEQTQVTYMKPQEEIRQAALQSKPLPQPVTSPRQIAKRITPPPFIDKEGIFKKEEEPLSKAPEAIKPRISESAVIPVKKIITLPPVNMEKIDNPTYVNYYSTVREKIRRAAYYHYARTDTGEVYLTFIITKDGFLKDMRLIDEKSSSDPYLKDIALQSIRDASPFPAFPKELDYPQLTFNVIISFQVE